MTGNTVAPCTSTMKEFLTAMQKTLVAAITEARELAKKVGNSPTALAYVNARIEVLERLIIFVDKSRQEECMDMDQLKLETGETLTLDEIMENERGGVIEPAILDIAKKLKPGEARAIDSKVIKWGHFAGRVYMMRKMNRLAEEYGPVKRKDKFYLVRYTPEKLQQIKEREARKLARKS